MQPSVRALRRHLETAGHPPLPLTQRQAETRARIVTLGQCLMAEFGAKTVKFSALAQALRIAPATLRFHFADHDALLAALLARHLNHIADILAATPAIAKNRRAAYRAAIRTPSGSLTEAHTLLRRDRHTLHPEERAAIDTARRRVATLLAAGPAPPSRVHAAPPAVARARAPAKRKQARAPADGNRQRIQQLIARTQQLLAEMSAVPTPQARSAVQVSSKQSLLASSVARTHPALFTCQQTAARASVRAAITEKDVLF